MSCMLYKLIEPGIIIICTLAKLFQLTGNYFLIFSQYDFWLSLSVRARWYRAPTVYSTQLGVSP